MSDFVKYVVKLLGKRCPLWASVLTVFHFVRYPKPAGKNNANRFSVCVRDF